MCLGGRDDRAGGLMGAKGAPLGGFQADAPVLARATVDQEPGHWHRDTGVFREKGRVQSGWAPCDQSYSFSPPPGEGEESLGKRGLRAAFLLLPGAQAEGQIGGKQGSVLFPGGAWEAGVALML